MKTEALIDMLARGAGPAPQRIVFHRLVVAAAAGLGLSGLLAVLLLGSVPAALYATPAPWMKFLYTGALAGSVGWLTGCLSRPACAVKVPARFALAVVTTMLMLGVATLALKPGADRLSALLGSSWLSCPWNVLALSLPAFAAAMWAVRGLAPTRLRSAGFAAGCFAGSLGAMGYALACTEESTAFVAVWYSLGILLTGLLGALVAPRLLDW